MSDKKMTAIEWLQSIEMERDLTLGDWSKAKEMEKQQMIDFGFDTYCFISGIMKVPFEQLSENRLNAEHNYKENYEK
jgi:hypothetical protein